MRLCCLSLRHEGALGIGRLVFSLFRRCITFCKECKLCSRWQTLLADTLFSEFLTLGLMSFGRLLLLASIESPWLLALSSLLRLTNKEASNVLCYIVKHLGSGRARKKCRCKCLAGNTGNDIAENSGDDVPSVRSKLVSNKLKWPNFLFLSFICCRVI